MKAFLLAALKTARIADMRVAFEDASVSLNELVDLAIGDETHAWRAASLLYALRSVEGFALGSAELEHIVRSIPSKRDGHQRELLRLILNADWEHLDEALLFDLAVGLWTQTTKQSSVRIKALEIMLLLSSRYPELMNEVDCLMQDAYVDTLSPVIRRSAQRMWLAQKRNGRHD